MVVGQEGDPPLRMDFVSNLADVKVGDVVVTSGADGIYPRGFRVGWVEKSERGDGLSLAITVRPAVDFAPSRRCWSCSGRRAPRCPRDRRSRAGPLDEGSGVLLALVVALALQTTLSGLTITGARMVNLVVVAVVYVALMYGPVTGLLAGTAGGLAQDALAGASSASAACRRRSSGSWRVFWAPSSSSRSRSRGW